jgi:hypothetical protein
MIEDEDLLFLELEKDDDHLSEKMRERRILQMKFEYAQQQKQNEILKYECIAKEKALMQITTTTEKVIVHFCHKDFKRCRLIDKHLEVGILI